MPPIPLVILTLAVTSFISPAWCADTPAANVRERYIEQLSAAWQSFEVHESRAKNERKDFFTANLGLAAGAIETVVESREILLSKAEAQPRYHLGVAELRLAASAGAALQPAAELRAFQRLKVLTRYVVFRQGRRALLVYSEHLNDPQVAKFFAELAKDGRLWEARCSN